MKIRKTSWLDGDSTTEGYVAVLHLRRREIEELIGALMLANADGFPIVLEYELDSLLLEVDGK